MVSISARKIAQSLPSLPQPGFHLAPSVGQDNHYKARGYFDRCARGGDYAGLYAGESSRRFKLATPTRAKTTTFEWFFEAGEALQGDIVDPPAVGSDLPPTVQLVDDDGQERGLPHRCLQRRCRRQAGKLPIETYASHRRSVQPSRLRAFGSSSRAKMLASFTAHHSDRRGG